MKTDLDRPSAAPLSTRNKGLLLALTTAGISGMAVFLNSTGVRAFGDATLYTTAKNLVAALLLGVLVAGAAMARPSSRTRTPLPRGPAVWLGIGAVGALGGGLAFALFFEGLSRAASTQAAFIHKTLVVWVALLAIAFLRERLTVGHIAAIALLVIGQAMLSGGLPGLVAGSGEVMMLTATLLWATEIIIVKRLLARGFPALGLGFARLGIGIPLLVAFAAATGRLGALGAVPAEGWLWAALTGVILAAFVATWYSALARAGAIDVTAVLVLGAVITALLDAGIRGAALAPQSVGLLLVLVGSVIAAERMLRRPALVPAE